MRSTTLSRLLHVPALAALGLMPACSSDSSGPGPRSLEITVATHGTDFDPDGYEVIVNDRPPVAVAVADTIVVDDLDPGRVRVVLGSLASNCTVEGPNPLDVELQFFDDVAIRIDVTCLETEGDLVVRIDVLGPVGDPTGFGVTLDGVIHPTLSDEDEYAFLNVDAGEYELQLDDLASYCSLDAVPSVEVLPDTLTTVEVPVTCAYSVEGRILFSLATDGGWHLHTVAPDGRDVVPFGAFSGPQLRSSISRDGSRIVFISDRSIYAIDPDGLDVRLVLFDAGKTPKISPDGQRIAYSRYGEIWVMDFDGSNSVQVTSGMGYAHSPDWSPDGQELAFEVEDADGFWDLYTIDVDGTDLTRLTTNAHNELDAAYRPDGTGFAFHWVRGGPKIVTSDRQGLNLTEIVAGGWDPSWSPDGTMLAYHDDEDPYGLYVVNLESRQVTPITAGERPGARAVHSAWGPPLP